MLCVNTSVIAIITIKNVDYRCIIYNLSKSEANNLFENVILENGGYIYKKYYLTSMSIQDSFFFTILYTMVDIIHIYYSLNISIGKVM